MSFINNYEKCICARDVVIVINGNRVMQAKKLEIRRFSEVKEVRQCFFSEPAALIRKNVSYKVMLEGIRFLRPFRNCNFADLDNFTFYGCMWEDFLAAADEKSFSEHITARAVRMETEESE